MDAFFRILNIARIALTGGLTAFVKKYPAETATIGGVQYVIACLDAMISRKPLPPMNK